MKLLRLLVLLLLIGLLISGCGPEAPVSDGSSAGGETDAGGIEPTMTEPTPTEPPPPTETPVPDTPTPTIEPTATLEPTREPFNGPSRIVFSSNRETPDLLGLYLLDPVSGEITPVNAGMDVILGADWSPDGHRIAFTVTDPWSIYVIDPDGTNLVQVTDYSSAFPSWSPDSMRIVHQSDHQNEPKDTPDIYIINADGSEMVEILDKPDVPDFQADWSPDGESILFISRRDGGSAFYTMNPDGSQVEKLFEPPEPVITGVWSPDGTQIAFIAGRFGGNNLYIVNADGSDITQLDDTGTCNDPSWSPDGKKLVFSSNRTENFDLWVINVDGSGLMQLTDDEYYDAFPDWSVGLME